LALVVWLLKWQDYSGGKLVDKFCGVLFLKKTTKKTTKNYGNIFREEVTNISALDATDPQVSKKSQRPAML